MKTIKTGPPMGGTSKETILAASESEQAALLDFITRGRRAQEAVDAILARAEERPYDGNLRLSRSSRTTRRE
jgi:hypothetical protein